MRETPTGIEESQPIGCPRCGYDQRGEVAVWREVCPLAGTCAECGLGWMWGDLLKPCLIGPRWCIEFARSWREIPRRSLCTVAMMFRPDRFFADLRMSHRFRVRSTLGLLGVFVACIYFLVALNSGLLTWRMMQWAPGSIELKLATSLYAAALPLSQDPPQWCARPSISPPWSPAQMNAGYFNGDLGWHGVRTAIIQRDIQWLPSSRGTGAVAWIVLLGSMAFMTMSAFAIVPVSRHRARVRLGHLVRIALYSLVPIGWVILLGWLEQIVALAGVPYTALRFVVPASILWYPCFLMVWWKFAIRNYLMMPHAALLATSLCMIGCFTTLLLTSMLVILLNG